MNVSERERGEQNDLTMSIIGGIGRSRERNVNQVWSGS